MLEHREHTYSSRPNGCCSIKYLYVSAGTERTLIALGPTVAVLLNTCTSVLEHRERTLIALGPTVAVLLNTCMSVLEHRGHTYSSRPNGCCSIKYLYVSAGTQREGTLIAHGLTVAVLLNTCTSVLEHREREHL